jgi:Tfp pilus assembly protein PilN
MVRRINLVPPSERRRTQSDVGLLVLLVVVVAVLAGLGYTYFHYQTTLTDRQNELAQAQAEVQKVQQQLAALAQYEQLQQSKDAVEKVVQQIYAGRTLVSEILGDISLVVPKDAWFQSLQLGAPDVSAVIASFPGAAPAAPNTAAPVGQFSIAAKTYTFEGAAGFLVRIEQVPAFTSVTFTGQLMPKPVASSPPANVTDVGLQGGVVNTQASDTPLPLTQVEVQSTGGTKQ